ncbi:MAG: hypothetical protein H6625_09685 [Bdellovibrionaceae bacterium]|nr:hypothetical protein [Pseudobdellovibrionaceae bacterium]
MRQGLFFLFLFTLLSGCKLNRDISGNASSNTEPAVNSNLSANSTAITLMETDTDFQDVTSLNLELSKALDKPLIISLSTVDIYATSGIDYVLPYTTLTLLAGSISVNVPILIKGDILGEGSENFKIQLSVNDPNVNLLDSEIAVTISDNDPRVLQVNPLYPTSGSNFLDLVENAPTTALIDIADTTCSYTPGSSKYDDCLDGGYYKKVIATGEHSCDNLILEDNLGVFNWVCSESEDPVFFYSDNMKEYKGLKDVLNPTTFKDNFVDLKKSGSSIATSTPGVWWSNVISPITLNSGEADSRLNLSTSGTIYTISGGGTSRGITISGARVALVNLGASVSSMNPMDGDCLDFSGGTQECLIKIVPGANAAYVEGAYIGTFNLHSLISLDANLGVSIPIVNLNLLDLKGVTTGFGIYSDSARLDGLNIKQSKIDNFAFNIGLMGSGFDQLVRDTILLNAASISFNISINCWNLKIVNMKIINSGSIAIGTLPWYTILKNIVIFNNGGNGIQEFAQGTIADQILSVGNSGDGLNMTLTAGVLKNINSFNNLGSGLNLGGSGAPSRVYNSIIANNNLGFNNRTIGGTYANLIITDNNTGIDYNNSANNTVFSGQLILGNTTNCSYTSAGANPGLQGANCDNQGSSDAIASTGTAAGLFQGKVTSESVNTHSTGSSLASLITDWLNFENPFRLWAADAISALVTATRGRCTDTGNCRIWDMQLLNTANLTYNFHGPFVNNATCPASVQGDVTDLYFSNPYLLNASEILFDRIGNDNGLCESGESCIYTPHLGYYQGSGDYKTNTCNFVNGTGVNAVTNVKLYAYPQ